MSDTGNHTLKLLQEMRKEHREDMDDLRTRLDGITHILTLIAGHSHALDERVASLEQKS